MTRKFDSRLHRLKLLCEKFRRLLPVSPAGCGITDDKKFARDLLRATHILVVPGSGFDWAEPDHFRLVMLPEAEQLRQAMIRMGDFLDGYHQK